MRLLGDKKVLSFVKLGDKNCKIKLLGSIQQIIIAFRELILSGMVFHWRFEKDFSIE